MGINYLIRGREHLEKERACIIVANHQSLIDFIGMFHLWPIMGRCTVLANRNILLAAPIGLACWLSGVIYIDLHNSKKSIYILNKAIDKIKNSKARFSLIYYLIF